MRGVAIALLLGGCWTAAEPAAPAPTPTRKVSADEPCPDHRFRVFAQRAGAELETIRVVSRIEWYVGQHACEELPDYQCMERARREVKLPEGHRVDRVEVVTEGPVIAWEAVMLVAGAQQVHRATTKQDLAAVLRQNYAAGGNWRLLEIREIRSGERFAQPYLIGPPGTYTRVGSLRWLGTEDIVRIHELAELEAMRVVRWERREHDIVVDVTCDVSPSS